MATATKPKPCAQLQFQSDRPLFLGVGLTQQFAGVRSQTRLVCGQDLPIEPSARND